MKAIFLQRFMAYHNRIPLQSLKNEIICSTDVECLEALQLPENPDKQNPTAFRYAHCTRGTCHIAESHLHPAFGTGLLATNNTVSGFSIVNETQPSTNELPEKPVWTESNWAGALDVCYVVEDAPLFGGLVFGGGVFIFLVCCALSWYLSFRIISKQKSIAEKEVAIDEFRQYL